MPKISIVIPNYKGEKYLTACMESIAAQEMTDYEVIVVDNGSTDLAIPNLEEWQSSHEISLSIEKLEQNTGFCHAVNVGIKKAKGKYVFLLNNDTTLEPDCLLELYLFMETHPTAFSASAKMLSMAKPEIADDCGDYYNALGYAFAAGKGKRQEKYDKPCRIFAACGGAAIYRKKALLELGGFDENHFAYLEDVDVGYRARIRGMRNFFVPWAIVYHAGSAVSGSRHNAFKVSLSSKNSIYLFYKNQPILQKILNFPFLLLGTLVKTLFFARKGLAGTYMKGIWAGCKLSFSKEGRAHKVPFHFCNTKNYLRIQLELWMNLFRMLFR